MAKILENNPTLDREQAAVAIKEALAMVEQYAIVVQMVQVGMDQCEHEETHSEEKVFAEVDAVLENLKKKGDG